jgi:uracil-DNA glycosylase
MKHPVDIEPSWKAVLADEFEQPYWEALADFVRDEYRSATVYPPPPFVFNAFALCPFDRVRVVILGQDPYHGPSQAHGLSFSVPEGVSLPPSLKNIYKELRSDLGRDIPTSGNLEPWAQQGILLLNATLTVRGSTPGSHQHRGWETFTDAVIEHLSRDKEHLVFLLWGKYAQEKGTKIDRNKHLVLTAPHPSPFSAHSGFFGCRHFSQTNDYLASHSLAPIEW